MSCLDVMYQVYGPPKPYFAAAYSPYPQVRGVGGVASGGWPPGLTKRKKGKGEGEGGWGRRAGVCDGERSGAASHPGAGLCTVRTAGPEGENGTSDPIRHRRDFFPHFLFFIFLLSWAGLRPSSAAAGGDVTGLQRATGKGEGGLPEVRPGRRRGSSSAPLFAGLPGMLPLQPRSAAGPPGLSWGRACAAW